MKLKRNAAFALSLIFNLISAFAADDTSHVKPLMHKNLEALLNLQRYGASAQEFNDPKNAANIESNLEQLVTVGSTLPKMINKEKPGLTAISVLFADYMNNAQSNFKAGYKEYARNQVRTISGFCMACHTSGEGKIEFSTQAGLSETKDLNLAQQADFFAATRQFDQALATYERLIFGETSANENQVIELSHAIRNYLSISIRVKQSPKTTFAFLARVQMSQKASKFFENDIIQWKTDVASWMRERPIKDNELSVPQLLKRAQNLMNLARSKQLFAADHTGDVNFLRSTTFSQQALSRTRIKTERALAYFLLGQAYAALSDPLLWELDGLYFEACINELPHSAQSRKCFKHLASGIYLGYGGSGGINVPTQDSERLSRLRKLAE